MPACGTGTAYRHLTMRKQADPASGRTHHTAHGLTG